MNFIIDPEYLTSITIVTDHIKSLPEDEQLIQKLKGHSYTSVRSIDHPEFSKLREQLGTDGFIKIERGWWNGDVVKKPFSINGAKFKKNEAFHSGSAIKYTIDSKLKKK